MYVDFEGEVRWFKGFEEDRDMGQNLKEGSDARNKIESEQGHYVANVYISKEARDKMVEDGIPNKGMVGQLFKEDDKGIYYKCKRPHFNTKINRGEGKEFGPPVVVDSDGNPWDPEVAVGNGSIVKMRVDVWDNKIVTWHATKILEHVEFSGESDDGLEGF